MTFSDGSRYEGAFSNGMLHGPGVMLYNTGDKYVGNFENDMMEGIGIYYSKSNMTKR